MSGHVIPEDRRMKAFKFKFTAQESRDNGSRKWLYDSLDKEFKTKGYRPRKEPWAEEK